MSLWTPSQLFSQAKHPPVIEYQGKVGIFLTEDQARSIAEDREKGIAYYKKWTVAESQIIATEEKYRNEVTRHEKTRADLELEKQNTMSQEDLNKECEIDRDLLDKAYRKERAKNKLLPWIGLGGIAVGILAGSRLN